MDARRKVRSGITDTSHSGQGDSSGDVSHHVKSTDGHAVGRGETALGSWMFEAWAQSSRKRPRERQQCVLSEVVGRNGKVPGMAWVIQFPGRGTQADRGRPQRDEGERNGSFPGGFRPGLVISFLFISLPLYVTSSFPPTQQSSLPSGTQL